MAFLTFEDRAEYPVTFLVPVIRKDDIQREYLDPFGIPLGEVLIMSLHYSQETKKTPAAEMKEFFTSEIAPTLTDMKTQYIVVADSEYFKVLTKSAKTEANLGYVMDCAFGPWKVVYVPNYRAVFYDPEKIRAKISQGMTALVDHATSQYVEPGSDIIHFAAYPDTTEKIKWWLEELLKRNVPLTIDIEAFDLKHHKAGIGTITFCWNKHEGIAFAVDYKAENYLGTIINDKGKEVEVPMYGRQVRNEEVRALLKDFFKRYLAKAIYHNISYDVYVLIYQLFMTDILDTEGLLEGMDVMLREWDDTKLIAYLATNSCAGNSLGLKDQAQDFAGNYAKEDIKDIRRIPLAELLEYNLVDGLSTWHTHEKHYQTMVDDDQLDIYENLFKPATLDIIQMQLTGMPVNMNQVGVVRFILTQILNNALDSLAANEIVERFTYRMNEKWVEEKNKKLKVKRVSMADAKEQFNPNSGPQLQDLLFNMLGLPVINLTDSKQPSVDRETIEALVNHATDPKVKAFLDAMIDYAAVNKILTSFIPALENAALGPDGWHYLSGNFNLGGTVSGRLSSSDPNLQNLPANVMMAISAALHALLGDQLKPYMVKGKLSLGKLIKSCFEAPPGWIFCGLDFASLEDRISALTTKDPNKLKVYTDGYDGHCLRAFSYFGEQMPDIDPLSVASINSIESKYKTFRQDSKAPTFALTYAGTWKTLMKNCGFSEEVAKSIEAKYHSLYVVSTQWVQSKLDQASRDGYVTVAFGLRVRTPLLNQVIRGTSKTPFEAEAEGRTAGNALGQSWCLLNSRASAEFMGVVRKSEQKLNIRPCAHIHDAQYMLVKDDINSIMFANKHLVKAVKWQEHPDIAHDEVKLGGEFSIFWPTWSNEIGIPNDANEAEVFSIINEAVG